MLIVGEKLNSSNGQVKRALEEGDWPCVARLAVRQQQAGAQALDLNAGAFGGREAELLARMAEALPEEVTVPLWIDSAKPRVMEAIAGRLSHRTLVFNSATLDPASLEPVSSLAARLQARMVVLALEKGRALADERSLGEGLEALARRLEACGLPRQQVWVDPVVLPLAFYPEDITRMLALLSRIRAEGFKAVCGLSNVSYQMPRRRALHRALLPSMMERGLDAVILDPTERALMEIARAGEALFSEGEGVTDYIRAAR